MIKVITGMRRCGKSYLLFTLFKNYLIKQGVKEDHIIGVNLENRLNKSLRDPDALLQYIDSRLSSDGQYYVMLDEVQMVSEFEDVLNSFLSISNVDIWEYMLSMMNSASSWSLTSQQPLLVTQRCCRISLRNVIEVVRMSCIYC